jgi:hypothetical protein
MDKIQSKSRRLQRLTLITLGVLATAVALFYLEEDWRGKRAWDQCQAALEAKGIVVDWDKFVPPLVPDDRNFYTASTNILLRFRRAQTDAESVAAAQLDWLPVDRLPDAALMSMHATNSKPVIIAELAFVSRGAGAVSARPPDFEDPVARQHAREVVDNLVGRKLQGVIGTQLSEMQFSNFVPAKFAFRSDTIPSTTELENLFASESVTNLGRLYVVSMDDSNFRVLLADVQVTAAEDYLRLTDSFVPALDEIRTALTRPYALPPGDYAVPHLMPIPNFITLREVSQLLGERAQCHLLLHEPDAAVQELTLVHELCRILQKPPAGKPEMLLEAMVNVTLTGLYVSIVADGFRLHEWRAPQLEVLQDQLKTIDLAPWVAEGLRAGLAGNVRTLSSPSAYKIAFELVGSHREPTFWSMFQNPRLLLLKYAPRGWIWQDIVNLATLQSKLLECFTDTHGMISPEPFERAEQDSKEFLEHKSPFKIYAAITFPNFVKAMRSTAYNQTLADEAQIACALELYRLARGEYPATLDVLEPQCIRDLPHDIINGQPLHYRRTTGGKFLLYSVGWNEKDDGGVTAHKPDGSEDYADGDWVWQYPAK